MSSADPGGRRTRLRPWRRSRVSLRGVFTLRERYALRCMFEQVLTEQRQPPAAAGRAADGTGSERRSVVHVRVDGETVRVEHSDGLVLRLVGVAAQVAQTLAVAVAQQKVELLRRTARRAVFEVRNYQASVGTGQTLQVHARRVEVC